MTEQRVPRDGTAWVALGAALWGTDALLRTHLVGDLPPASIVLAEHVIVVLVLLPLLWRTAPQVAALPAKGKLALLGIGAGASALATVLFTEAFSYGDPVAPALLQQTQPLVAITLAWLVLRERPRKGLAPFALLALLGAFLVAFPHPSQISVESARGALFALGAATLWASGTVLGRLLSGALPFVTLTAWRFAVGLPAALVLALVLDAPLLPGAGNLPALAGLALVPGLLALLVYYHGLRRTPAARATLAELAYPSTAALVGVVFLDASMTGSQLVGAALVAGTVTALARTSARAPLATVSTPTEPVLAPA